MPAPQATNDFTGAINQQPQLNDENKILKDYDKQLQEIQNTDASLNKTQKALSEYSSYLEKNLNLEEIKQADIPFVSSAAGALSKGTTKIADFIGATSPEYQNYKRAVETDLITSMIRNEGLPITDSTLKHYRDLYDPSSLSVKQIQDTINLERKRNLARNSVIALRTNIPNPAKIGTDEQFYKSTKEFVDNLEQINNAVNAPTAHRLNRFPQTEELTDENATIVKNDLDELFKENPYANQSEIFQKITGVPMEQATEKELQDFLTTYSESIHSKKMDRSVIHLLSDVAIAASVLLPPTVFSAGVIGTLLAIPPIYTGYKAGKKAYDEGQNISGILEAYGNSAKETFSEEASYLPDIGLGILGRKIGTTLLPKVIKKITDTHQNITGSGGSDKINNIGDVASKGLSKGINKVEKNIEDASEELAGKKISEGDLTKENIIRELENKGDIESEVLKIFDRNSKNSEMEDTPISAGQNLRKTLKEMSNSYSVEQLSQKTGLPRGTTRSTLESIENKFFPGMSTYTRMRKELTKINNNYGKSVPIEETIKALNKAGKWDPKQIEEMIPNILETTVPKDILDRVLAERPKTITSVPAEIIDGIYKGIKRFILRSKGTPMERAAREAEKTIKESLKRIKQEYKI